MYLKQRPQNVVNDGFALLEYTKSSETWDGDIQIHAFYLCNRAIWERKGRSFEGNRHKPAVNLLQDSEKMHRTRTSRGPNRRSTHPNLCRRAASNLVRHFFISSLSRKQPTTVLKSSGELAPLHCEKNSHHNLLGSSKSFQLHPIPNVHLNLN